MRTLKEFEEEIRERENLLKNIILHKRDYEFLSAPDDAGLIRFFSKRPIFARSSDAILKLLCIEVHKLFSDLKSDDFKWTQLLDKIKKHRKKSEWKELLSKEDINRIEKLIESGLKNRAINGLRNYRNKYLAHTDREKKAATFFVIHFNELIKISLEIIDLLRARILKDPFPLEAYIPYDGFDEIRNLAKD